MDDLAWAIVGREREMSRHRGFGICLAFLLIPPAVLSVVLMGPGALPVVAGATVACGLVALPYARIYNGACLAALAEDPQSFWRTHWRGWVATSTGRPGMRHDPQWWLVRGPGMTLLVLMLALSEKLGPPSSLPRAVVAALVLCPFVAGVAVALADCFIWVRWGRLVVKGRTGIDAPHLMATTGYVWSWWWGWDRPGYGLESDDPPG